MPSLQEVASEYKSLGDFLDRGYSLSEQNDKAEKPEKRDNVRKLLYGTHGYGAKKSQRKT